MTKTKRLLVFLRNGNEVTKKLAKQRFDIKNLSSSLNFLELQGYEIRQISKGTHKAWYIPGADRESNKRFSEMQADFDRAVMQ